ncbi:hypothetical protein Terro_3278 [Terriglobus roseus DSM 18391]|uniref:Uncharacterized protein n=1 Tax=Terriglobus roseus (strain DSM 18391 / NRRL B-41598 / KBS 63) TaxID=926566 RepID=I3ZJS7_TERRK|nr:hypothetical protein [Terriglobus roseus]AFL89495.1 hypothetical protein Terro_3278 [Terriglobus roseus DSM 18391]
MQPASRLPTRLFVAAVVALSCLSTVRADDVAVAKPTPTPAISLPLDAMGYRPATSPVSLRAGYTNATVNFIDPQHLLVTFTTKKLIPRSSEQREGDDDHFVRAVVIHLPDGKVLRETEWRVHDRASYLWPLGKGHFLLRIRGDLYSLDPMGSFNKEQLGKRTLLESDDDLQALEFSPSRDLMLVETTPPMKIGDDPAEAKDRPVSATFYRLAIDETGAVRLGNRGRATSKEAFSLAFTSMGVLQTVREDRTHWGFDFHTFAGKNIELAGFNSTCRPRSIFVSDAEFYAYGCRGGEDRKLMGGFNLLAEAKWVFTTNDAPLWLSVDAAPETGRFAVRNTLTTVGMQGSDRPDADEIRGQEVRVYGGREGDELLRVTSSPAQRPGGNFSLSPDGLQLAVLNGLHLEVYRLPPIPAADVKLHEREQAALAPMRPAAEMNVAAALSRTSTSSDGH